jgi:hypothetical protein
VIVLDGSKEPKGESGIVHSLKAKPPYARAAVFGGQSKGVRQPPRSTGRFASAHAALSRLLGSMV